MKKNLLKTILITLLFFCVPLYLNALEGYVKGNTVNIRQEPGTNGLYITALNNGTVLSIVDETLYEGSGCTEKWYKINYKNQTAYICSKYVTFEKPETTTTNTNTSTSTSPSLKGINTVDWTARVNSNNVAARKKASTSSATVDTLSLGVNVTILDTKTVSDANCSTGKWYKIQYYGNKVAYMCSKYITSKSDITLENEEYANTLREAGFPDSYIPYLNYLHSKYPNWVFKAKNTKVNFSNAVSGEENKNLMQTTNNSYRTSTKPAEGSSWYKINSGVIAFYMDPRNWLTKERIFMFEKLDYSSELENKYPEMVKAIFGTGKLSADKYTNPMVSAGKTNKVSPVHIASRIKQEVSSNGSSSTSGGSFKWKGKTYKGYYNFFNIGAYEVTINGVKYSAVTRGLAYAAKLISRTGKKWNNISTSILEGSNFIAKGYITKGQGTLYYQKFNVNPDAYYSRYTHQYMTNVQAPSSEGNSAYNSYKKASMLAQSFVFEIPVYNNMPDATSLPNSGDNNTNLKSLEMVDYTLSPSFDKDVLTYEVYVPPIINEITINAEAESEKSNVTGNGTITVNDGESNIKVTVKAENGETKNYIITIKREEKTEEGLTQVSAEITTPFDTILKNAGITLDGNYITNYKYNTYASTIKRLITNAGAKDVIISNSKGKELKDTSIITTNSRLMINNGKESKIYYFVIKGDTSGDGKITILDLLQIQKHIKGTKKLTGSYLKAADTSNDGKATILDLLQVQKHIKGDKKL